MRPDYLKSVEVIKSKLDLETVLSVIEGGAFYQCSHKFVILGKTGPTGKTWMTNKLRELGFKAIEISEEVNSILSYNDDYNHYITDFDNDVTVIILNHPLED